jgi:hypothetical protein
MACRQEVRHGFHLLVAKETTGMVLEATALEAGSGPTTILIYQSVENKNFTLRCPRFPD